MKVILQAETERLAGDPTYSLDEVRQKLKERCAKVVDSILKSLDRLEIFPDSGSHVPNNKLSDQGCYHMVLSGKYVSIYRVMGCE